MANRQLQKYTNGTDDNDKQLEKTTSQTKLVIDKIIQSQLHNAKLSTLSSSSTQSQTNYVRYTPTSIMNNNDLNSKQRIIKIVDQKTDPLLPPSFKIRKTPQGPSDEPPAPILHEETTEKLTKEDQKKWYIPPAISNWKNTKGFTIGIDKRLASIGKDEDQNKISNGFANLSEALKNAEKNAKEELVARAKLRDRVEKEKILENQKRLSKMAEDIRINNDRSDNNEFESTEDKELQSAAFKREQKRAERRRKAEKELKLSKMSTENKVKMLTKEQGRDVSERVALGVANSTHNEERESAYDSRLYLNAAGTTAAHSSDQLYDKPLFGAQDAINSIYRTRTDASFKGNTKGLGSKKDGNDIKNYTSGTVSFVKDGETGKRGHEEYGLNDSKRQKK